MQSSTERVKTILKEFHLLKMQVKNNLGGERLKAEVEFIENCINTLPEEDGRIIQAAYLGKTSVRKVAEGIFMSHSGLKKRISRIIKTLAKVYDGAKF